MAILTGPVTASGQTEVYLLSNESNFTTVVAQIPTRLAVTSHDGWSFVVDPSTGDLWCVKLLEVDTEMAELFILSRETNWTNVTWHNPIGLTATLASESFLFATPQRDLVVVEPGHSRKGTAHVHVYSRMSKFRSRSIYSDTGVITQGPRDQFTMKRNGDLVYIMRPALKGTLKYTYLAVMSEESKYSRIVKEVTTAFRL
mmetsp:Transcript_81750/g.243793  ORF Transcript_81750/g.243793 Transcript_81750/m.243793 type:complete len:200 (+) Transcript_81750:406-1005(+)